MLNRRNAEIAVKFYDAWNRRDFDRAGECLHEDVDFELVSIKLRLRGRTQVGQLLRTVSGKVADLRIILEKQIAWRTGTAHELHVLGSGPSGKAVDYRAVECWTLSGPHVVSIVSEAEMPAMLDQLGIDLGGMVPLTEYIG